jgi:hypothetical protein
MKEAYVAFLARLDELLLLDDTTMVIAEHEGKDIELRLTELDLFGNRNTALQAREAAEPLLTRIHESFEVVGEVEAKRERLVQMMRHDLGVPNTPPIRYPRRARP